jgi:Fe2+ or Zn2+ uptake regulation protein
MKHQTDYSVSESCEKLFRLYNIASTPRRMQVLRIVLSKPNSEFTITEIKALVKKEYPAVSNSSVVDALILFKNTGLIEKISRVQNPKSKKGRPEVRLIYPDKKQRCLTLEL